MRQRAVIEPLFDEPRAASLERPPAGPYASLLHSSPEGSRAVLPPAEAAAIIVGPGRVLTVLLGWHLLLGLAFAAGWMLS